RKGRSLTKPSHRRKFTMTFLFLSIAAVLAVGTGIWLASALRRDRGFDGEMDHQDANAAVLRDQLAELRADVANGTLSESEFAAAEQELHQRVLHEAAQS